VIKQYYQFEFIHLSLSKDFLKVKAANFSNHYGGSESTGVCIKLFLIFKFFLKEKLYVYRKGKIIIS
jgi:hypothetical protein